MFRITEINIGNVSLWMSMNIAIRNDLIEDRRDFENIYNRSKHGARYRVDNIVENEYWRQPI